MLPLQLVLKADEPIGEYSRVAFFFGWKDQTSQLAGELRLRIGELQLLSAALTLGAEQTSGHLEVIHKGYLSGGGVSPPLVEGVKT